MLMLQYSPHHCVGSFHFYSKWISSERLMLISCLLFMLVEFLGRENFLFLKKSFLTALAVNFLLAVSLRVAVSLTIKLCSASFRISSSCTL